MEDKIKFILSAVVIGGIILSLFAPVSLASPWSMERKIIVFDPGISEAEKSEILAEAKAEIIRDLPMVGARAILLSSKAERVLLEHPAVLRVEEDAKVYALIDDRLSRLLDSFSSRFDLLAKTTARSTQTVPWGVERIGAPLVWNLTVGDPIKLGIIDTGIEQKHPDLQANIKGGVSFVRYTRSYNDDNGHGTHVAGIAAALDNSVGVVGVGPKIDLYGIKVLDRRGSGYVSDIIAGLDWAIKNQMQIVNMSLGTTADIQSLHDAIQKVDRAGILQVAAAGNDGKAVNYPAAYEEVIAVSAANNSDVIASWSSRGPEIELAAPGENIYSTYRGKTYRNLSGTSMAAPHVAGTAALVLDAKTCDYNLDEICTPSEVRKRLAETAEDLGESGFDNLYGHGLVSAFKAVY